MTPQIAFAIILALVAVGIAVAWADDRYGWSWSYLRRHIDRALNTSDEDAAVGRWVR